MSKNYELELLAPRDDWSVIAVRGELHSHAAMELPSRVFELLGGKPANLVLDLSNLSYASSSGIGAIMELYKRIVLDASCSLRLEGASAMVRDVIELLGYSSWIGPV